ncbi:MAG TPA: ribosome recycling factor [Candidatus Saccharimonadales bacterium]|nr:ribosome recycling factor [Candidatus Saccharimonadales bacterium]
MNPTQLLTDAKNKLGQTVERFQANLKSLRTGRANASMLDGVMVEAYGTSMPLIQVGTIMVPEAQLIQITPFDPNNLQAIAEAIRNNSSLGLNPADDGRVVRIPIPPLNEERRKELAKQIGQKQEETMIALRNIRHDVLDEINLGKKDKDLGEDEAKRLTSQIEEAMSKARERIESIAKAKENEILTV